MKNHIRIYQICILASMVYGNALADVSVRASEWLREHPVTVPEGGETIRPNMSKWYGRNGPHRATNSGNIEEVRKKRIIQDNEADRPQRPVRRAANTILVKLKNTEDPKVSDIGSMLYSDNSAVNDLSRIEKILGKGVAIGTKKLVPVQHRDDQKKDINKSNALNQAIQAANTAKAHAFLKAKERGLDRWQEVRLSEGTNIEEALRLLHASDLVEAAEPDYLFGLSDFVPKKKSSTTDGYSSIETPSAAINASNTSPTATSSDPKYNEQWHLQTSKVTTAWQQLEDLGLESGGNRDVIVAVIDSGVDYTHPDLASNMWVNPLENADSRDSDGNGYVDDIYGINTTAGSGDPMDDHGHGTHVAGIIAAQAGNGLGGVGVAYNVRIMAIKAAQYSGTLTSSAIAAGIYYAVENGADVINMSFGGYGKSQLVEDALSVAFGQAVLVAAAGNDGKANAGTCDPNYGVMYPAAYNWVIGVMAQSQSPSPQGDHLASFSNWDCTPQDHVEYELMAPGISILSTLPGGIYAQWDGTSMATPVVAGAAALLRTRWPDRNIHSSRFLMAQLASTGPVLRGRTNPQTGQYKSYRALDVAAAMTDVPKPDLNYQEHWLFDTTAINAGNDDDGIIDAGETVDLAIVLRNHWGNASNVAATLEAWAEGATGPDPYVTVGTGTVNYGSIGAFNQKDNGFIRDAEGNITGVQQPFRFSLAANTPNDHIIPLRLTITARNGLDPGDTATYTKVAYFYLVAQNGRQLPAVIEQDTVLNPDTFWIIDRPVLIPSGVTLTINAGTRVQFWSSDPQKVYTTSQTPFLQVEGTLRVEGTQEYPVHLLVSELHNRRPLRIHHGEKADAYSSIQYAVIDNPYFGRNGNETTNWNTYRTNLISHCVFRQLSVDGIDGSDVNSWAYRPMVLADHITHSRFLRLGSNEYTDNHGRAFFGGNTHTSLFDHVFFTKSRAYYHNFENASNNVFLKNYSHYETPFDQVSKATEWGEKIIRGSAIGEKGTFHSNAILNLWNDPNPDHWMRFSTEESYESPNEVEFLMSHNYWGYASRSQINAAIIDYQDNFNYPKIVYEPILESPLEETYPFVVNIRLDAGGSTGVSTVGSEEVLFTVTFNRDMHSGVQPQVSFGPAAPWTDFTVQPVNGGWTNLRTWTGKATVTRMTGDGRQMIRVAGAVAADDQWLVTGDDSERFGFEVNTSDLESMNLVAISGPGYVDLSWTQDDFPMLAGYNIYRAISSEGPFIRVNPVLIPRGQSTFRDTSAEAGQTYYYHFTVMLTDFAESTPSNMANGVPKDGILPIIQHTPVTKSEPNVSVSISANVTDNVSVGQVILFTRTTGTSTFSQRQMVNTTGSRYSVTLRSSEVVEPGIDYYIRASDGINVAYSGSSGRPHKIMVGVPSSTASLSNLVLSSGTLSPVFASSTKAYTAKVKNAVASIKLTPTVADGNSTVRVNGSVVQTGQQSAAISLKVGDNKVTIEVTAQDGVTKSTYTVVLTRTPSSTANLSNLALTSGTLSPVFASPTKTYTAKVKNTVSSIKLTPTVADENSTVRVNGSVVQSGQQSAAISLKVGNNAVTIEVTAQDGTTKQTYTVTVKREASSNAKLKSLVVKGQKLSPKFKPGKKTYTVKVDELLKTVQVQPTAQDKNAKIKVNGTKVKSGKMTKKIKLNKTGKTVIKVVVTAQNKKTMTYTVTLRKP